MSCHSQPESANDLFSTLGVRVQAEGPPGMRWHTRATAPGTRRPGTRSRVPGLPRGPAELHRSDGLGLRSAVALRNLELDALTFFERAVAVRLNSREVDEDVPTTVDRDEAVALIRVEPFDGALSHVQQLPNSCPG